MENHLYKSTGISLFTGALLMVVIMTLHPSGGNIEQLIKMARPMMMAHSLAIFSLPIILFGFYGLTISLLNKWKLSMLAFIIMAFGCIAAMFAALFNGLVLPYFLNRYSDQLEDKLDLLHTIVDFSFSINIPLDYIFIVACCIAIFIYSSIMLLGTKFPKWIAYFGLLIIIFAIIGGAAGFVFTSLTGFRIFIFSLAAWIIFSGGLLFRYKIDS